MKLHRSAAQLALVGLALLGFTARAAAKEQVPFSGRFEATVTVTPDVPPFVFVLVQGAGNASHLGHLTVAIPHVVNRDARTAIGTYEFTAANGDALFADFTGKSMPTPTPGVLYIVESATITGGTGRFKGARGSFVCERLYDAIAGETIGVFSGSISSPGANKQ